MTPLNTCVWDVPDGEYEVETALVVVGGRYHRRNSQCQPGEAEDSLAREDSVEVPKATAEETREDAVEHSVQPR